MSYPPIGRAAVVLQLDRDYGSAIRVGGGSVGQRVPPEIDCRSGREQCRVVIRHRKCDEGLIRFIARPRTHIVAQFGTDCGPEFPRV